MKRLFFCILCCFGITSLNWTFSVVQAASEEIYVITLQDHRFSPAELIIPSNKKVKIMVENRDSTAEEFESYSLNREKMITGKGTIILYIGPLKPGSYKYFGEFHQSTAQGIITTK